MERQHFSTGTQWESIVGYSRVVRVGNQIFVTGTTATDYATGKIVGFGNPYLQTKQIIQNITFALEQVGATVHDVVRTRIYVLNISDWELVGKAHGETFGEILPATTMVEVSRLIDPNMLVEIEADAIINR